MSSRCKKTCKNCGKKWGIAKKVCKCGHDLSAKKVDTPTPKKTEEAKKQCPKCRLQWSTTKKRVCTCGHSFTKRKHGAVAASAKTQKCRACGATRKGHVCSAKPSRPQSARAPSKPFADKDQQTTTSTPVIHRRKSVKCVFCYIRKTIVNLMKQCDSSTNLKRLEKSISKVVAEAKTAISKLEKAVSQAQQMVQELKKKTCVPRLNAFDVMRLSSQKKTTPKNPPKPTNSRPTQPTNRSKAIIAGQVVKQQKLNEQFLLSLTSGGATSLQLPRINNDGQDQRPDQIVNRHTAGRRLETAKHGLLTAAKEDGATLVWLIRTLYNLPGLRQAFDVALLQDLRTV